MKRDSSPPPRRWWLGLIVAAIGLFWLYGARAIDATTHVIGVGPATMVSLVGGALLVLGVLLAVQEWRGLAPRAEDDDDGGEFSWRSFGLALAAIALPLLSMQWLGFVATVCGVFALVTRAFGSRRLGFDLLVGAVVGAVSWWGFAALGVNLGPLLPLLH